MSLIEIKQSLTTRDRWVFVIAWLLILGFVAVLRFSSSGLGVVPLAFGGSALLLPIVALFEKRAIDWTYKAMATLTWPIGFAMAHVILAFIFYGLVTPIGLLRRLFGHDPLKRRSKTAATTYWEELDQNKEPSSYFRPF